MDKKIDKFLTTRVQTDSKDGVEIQLWKSFEGYDIVVIENNDISFCKFINNYEDAIKLFNNLKDKGGKYG